MTKFVNSKRIANWRHSAEALSPRVARGFTLIELLIASLVLAGGIATFLLLQIQSLNDTRLANQLCVAVTPQNQKTSPALWIILDAAFAHWLRHH